MVLVREKNSKKQLCINFRRLNLKAIKDGFPLPRIEESLDPMAGATLFSTIDLQSSSNKVEVDERDHHKTACTTPKGLYEYNHMPFRLCNAPATFQ